MSRIVTALKRMRAEVMPSLSYAFWPWLNETMINWQPVNSHMPPMKQRTRTLALNRD